MNSDVEGKLWSMKPKYDSRTGKLINKQSQKNSKQTSSVSVNKKKLNSTTYDVTMVLVAVGICILCLGVGELFTGGNLFSNSSSNSGNPNAVRKAKRPSYLSTLENNTELDLFSSMIRDSSLRHDNVGSSYIAGGLNNSSYRKFRKELIHIENVHHTFNDGPTPPKFSTTGVPVATDGVHAIAKINGKTTGPFYQNKFIKHHGRLFFHDTIAIFKDRDNQGVNAYTIKRITFVLSPHINYIYKNEKVFSLVKILPGWQY